MNNNIKRQIEIKSGQVKQANRKILSQSNRLQVNRYRVSQALFSDRAGFLRKAVVPSRHTAYS